MKEIDDKYSILSQQSSVSVAGAALAAREAAAKQRAVELSKRRERLQRAKRRRAARNDGEEDASDANDSDDADDEEDAELRGLNDEALEREVRLVEQLLEQQVGGSSGVDVGTGDAAGAAAPQADAASAGTTPNGRSRNTPWAGATETPVRRTPTGILAIYYSETGFGNFTCKQKRAGMLHGLWQCVALGLVFGTRRYSCIDSRHSGPTSDEITHPRHHLDDAS